MFKFSNENMEIWEVLKAAKFGQKTKYYQSLDILRDC
jgi:hypothetical protein